MLVEKSDDDNESCRLVEIGDGSNGRYVADRGPCTPPPQPAINSIFPASAKQGTCVAITITGSNLAPELQVFLSGGTGPLPAVKSTSFDAAGAFVTATVCIPKAKGGGRSPKLGNSPLWDVSLRSGYTSTNSNVLTKAFVVTP